jgi:ABC-type bacteriocin/lantibiotic exporter with double-glycine peptidase domain
LNIIKSIYANLNQEEKKLFFLIAFFMSCLLILELFSLSILLPIIKIILSGKKILVFDQSFFFNNLTFEHQLYYLLFGLLFVFFLKNTFYLLFLYLKKKFLAGIQVGFSGRIFNSYIVQPYEFYLKNNKPQIIRNLGLLNEYVIILENIINIAIEVLILTLILFLIFYNSFNIGLFIGTLSIIFIFVFLGIFKNKFKKYGNLINKYNAKIVNDYLDTLGSIKEIILKKKQNFFLNSFIKNISSKTSIVVKNGVIIETPKLLVEFFLVFGIVLLIFFLIKFNNNIQQASVVFVFTITLILRAIPSITRIIYQGSGFYHKLDTIIKVHHLIDEFKKNKNITKICNSKKIYFNTLELKNISYSYKNSEDTRMVLNNFNLTIKKNEAIGVLGKSGSGKSTLLDLIAGLIFADKGQIILDGLILNNESASAWQKSISYIYQKNYLLNGTIAENIAFAEEEVDETRIKDSLKFARLESFVASLKNGVNTYIGEDGKNLSGGQRQRIILARAIYSKSDLIILDEATSALDSKTEKEIFIDIKNTFYNKKTLIISSHNKENLFFCDKVISLK